MIIKIKTAKKNFIVKPSFSNQDFKILLLHLIELIELFKRSNRLQKQITNEYVNLIFSKLYKKRTKNLSRNITTDKIRSQAQSRRLFKKFHCCSTQNLQ